jgi:hypothetical protein
MAALTQERYPSRQKPGMVTSMDVMTDHAILRNRGVLECKRTPLFRMAFITKLVYGIGFDHCLAIIRRTHSIVAARTGDLSLSDRMMRLFIGLRPDVLMA